MVYFFVGYRRGVGIIGVKNDDRKNVKQSASYGHKKTSNKLMLEVIINMATTYSPGVMRVPSAMGDLTSLFGMGRGEHPRQNHHKTLIINNY